MGAKEPPAGFEPALLAYETSAQPTTLRWRQADDRDRTGDLGLGKPALFQLSYVRDGERVSRTPAPRRPRGSNPARHRCRFALQKPVDGIEPTTSRLQGGCSAKLSYTGAHRGDRGRTCDLPDPNRARYHFATPRKAEGAGVEPGGQQAPAGLANRCGNHPRFTFQAVDRGVEPLRRSATRFRGGLGTTADLSTSSPVPPALRRNRRHAAR